MTSTTFLTQSLSNQYLPTKYTIPGCIAIILASTAFSLASQGVSPSLNVQYSEKDLKIQEAKTELAKNYQDLLEGINRINFNPKDIETPGLNQAAIMNWGVEIASNIQKQQKNPEHPNYRTSIESGLTRSLLTNGQQLLLTAALGNVLTKQGGESGIKITYYDPSLNKQQHLHLPPEALQVIANGYIQAITTQQINKTQVKTETAIQVHDLLEDTNEFAESSLQVAAIEGREDFVEQIQNLQRQLSAEKEYYVGLNGDIHYAEPE